VAVALKAGIDRYAVSVSWMVIPPVGIALPDFDPGVLHWTPIYVEDMPHQVSRDTVSTTRLPCYPREIVVVV
jgi:hypothetical protein